MHRSILAPERTDWSTADAYDWCQRLAVGHYENFPVASLLLPRTARPHIAAFYAFARIADDIADEPGMSNEERLRLLNDWEKQLLEAKDGRATHPVFAALSESAFRLTIDYSLFTHLLSAFRQDVVKHRYMSFNELLDYCRRSANPVGRLVLQIFNFRDERMFELSDAICTALQLTNFWQDMSVDGSAGRIYAPLEDLRRFGVAEEDILLRRGSASFANLMAYQVSRTRELFHQGRPLIAMLQSPVSLEIRLTWAGGMRILDKIESSGYTVLQTRPRLRWTDGPTLLLQTLLDR